MTKEYVSEVSATLKRMTILFSVGFVITDKKNIHETYYFSVITEILIHLKDLTQKLKRNENGIYFSDDIPITSNYQDITSLVVHCRDAACHNDSYKRRNKKGYLFSNNVFACDDFDDDITILMGDEKIYVKRHLLRLYKEVLVKFMSYPELHDEPDYIEAIDLAKYLKHIQ